MIHFEVTFHRLIVRCEKLVEVAFKVANQLIFIIVIFIEDFDLDDLISLEQVVHLEDLLEIRAQVIVDGFSAADTLPLEVFLGLDVDDAERITFTSRVQVGQPTTLDLQRDLVWALD